MTVENNNKLGKFYAGKTILVTGHTGFKGAWLSLWLTKLGARVIGLSLPEIGDLTRAMFRPPIAVALALDLRDHDAVNKAVRAEAPEIVFHLAAQSLVRRSVEDPLGTFATNVMGTAHLLDAACRNARTQVVLNVTSDKCYLNPGPSRAFVESDALGGRDPYSASKACSEIVTMAWSASLRNAGKPALATARAGNVIGGGDDAADRIVPDIVRAITTSQPVVLRNPGATRPWQHVLDPLAGYLALAHALYEDAPRHEGAWNFGPDTGEVINVRELARRVIDRFGRGSIIETPGQNGPQEAQSLALDVSKAKRVLGWKPMINLDRAVDMTVDWYCRVIERREDPVLVTNEQIAIFLAA
jgi:CDP-glucose 4,6-dehydratase